MNNLPTDSGENEWVEHMRGCLGKQVRVIINRDPEVAVIGQLLSFDEGGEVAVRRDDGYIGWSWPNLETTIINTPV